MLQVRTYLNKSNIHGIGLFAGQYIKEGTIIWKFTENIDQWIPAPYVDDITNEEAEFIENAAVYDEDQDAFCLVADNVRFMNHSSNPNCGETGKTTKNGLEMFALRDIVKGEEITLDYNQMEEGSDDFSDEIHKRYNTK